MMPKRAKSDSENNSYESKSPLDIKKFAIDCILTYFEDKHWYIGGKIPESELLSKDSIKTVLKTQFDEETFSFIHEVCLPKIAQDPTYKESIPWTIVCLISMLSEMGRLCIPKYCQPGIILLYFKFCKGVKIPNPPLD